MDAVGKSTEAVGYWCIEDKGRARGRERERTTNSTGRRRERNAVVGRFEGEERRGVHGGESEQTRRDEPGLSRREE